MKKKELRARQEQISSWGVNVSRAKNEAGPVRTVQPDACGAQQKLISPPESLLLDVISHHPDLN